MSPLEMVGVVLLVIFGVALLGLAFLGFLVMVKLLWLIRNAPKARKEVADVNSNPDVPAS